MIEIENFTRPLQWHAQFYGIVYSKDQLFLLSETRPYYFQDKMAVTLWTHLKTPQHLQQLMTGFSSPSDQANCLLKVEQLLSEGFLIYANQDDAQQDDSAIGREVKVGNYYSPVFNLPLKVRKLHSHGNPITLLSQWTDLDVMIPHWLRLANLPASVNIVFTDDYLDPRLATINHQQRDAKQPWLLIKPVGRQLMLGPYFSGVEGDAPCWQCLFHRINDNQPIRKMLQTYTLRAIVPLPVNGNNYLNKQCIETLEDTIKDYLQEKNTHQLLVINSQDISVTRHSVQRIVDCDTCGSAATLSTYGPEPIKLHSNKKIVTQDGGVRSVMPEKTLALFDHHISPLTGFVNELSELESKQEGALKIFRTSFYKMPLTADAFSNNDTIQVCLGKGVSPTQSKVSALCEAVERKNALYRGNENSRLSPAEKLNATALTPAQLAPFSETQYMSFSRCLPDCPENKQAILPWQHCIPLHWSPAWSLTYDEGRYLPTAYCYANTPFDQSYCRWTSNGCATGNTLEEAILQGFLELVERDASAIWWYNKIVRPSVDFSSLPGAQLDVISRTLNAEWNYWVLDLTHDINIPVMAAIARHRRKGVFCLGFGCHLDVKLACIRALTELCQLIPVREQKSLHFNFDDIQPEPFLLPLQCNRTLEQKKLEEFPIRESSDICVDIDIGTRETARIGLETIVFDYTRPDFPLSTIKVVVPGLCHIWPQLGNPRLYQVPVNMGWRSVPLRESELNRMSLYI